MRWIKEMEVATSVDDPEMSQAIQGHRFPKF